MQPTYTFLYFNSEGTLVRVATGPCDSLQHAMQLAIRECGLCERFQVSANGKVLWSGTPAEARKAASNGETPAIQSEQRRTG